MKVFYKWNILPCLTTQNIKHCTTSLYSFCRTHIVHKLHKTMTSTSKAKTLTRIYSTLLKNFQYDLKVNPPQHYTLQFLATNFENDVNSGRLHTENLFILTWKMCQYIRKSYKAKLNMVKGANYRLTLILSGDWK